MSVCVCAQLVCQHACQENQRTTCLCRMRVCIFIRLVQMCACVFTQPTCAYRPLVAGSAGQVITGNHETYLISADSAESADSWVAAIRRVMHEVSYTHQAKPYLLITQTLCSFFPALWWWHVWPELGGDASG